jgi:hypothetical protein
MHCTGRAIEIIGEMVAVCNAPTVLPEENKISPETWMTAWQALLSRRRDRGGGFKRKRVEGKIKANGTTLPPFAGLLLSAHWLGDGARHCPQGGTVPRVLGNPAFVGLFCGTMTDLIARQGGMSRQHPV